MGAGEKDRLRQLGGHAVERLGGALARRGFVVQVRDVVLGHRRQLQPGEIPDDHCLGRSGTGRVSSNSGASSRSAAHALQPDQQVVVGAVAIGGAQSRK